MLLSRRGQFSALLLSVFEIKLQDYVSGVQSSLTHFPGKEPCDMNFLVLNLANILDGTPVACIAYSNTIMLVYVSYVIQNNLEGEEVLSCLSLFSKVIV